MSLKKYLLFVGALLVILAVAAACGPSSTELEVPFKASWEGSGHADSTAEAFIHWNEDDPAVVPTSCAKCHTSAGYQDFLGADGTEAGKVDAEVPAPAGTITCVTCHNEVTKSLTSVTFPSGVTIDDLGPEARCITCHQGRESQVSVDAAIAKFNATDALDEVPAPITNDSGAQQTLGFLNIHYFTAGVTMYGGEVHGGYEYSGKSYDAKYDHVEGYDTCVDCHDSHTLEVQVQQCAVCHEITELEELKGVREKASFMDYDGDGDTTEGMYYEIQGMQEVLYSTIQAYASEVAGTAIIYAADSHPYFFIDTNSNGSADDGEATRNNAYSTWTPRLLKAAYNYHLSFKDPGAFAHGNKYIIQLLFDSIEDLNTKLSTPIDMSKMHRDDAGHFAGNTEPFRHWDEDEGIVPGECAKCHTASGLPTFLTEAALSRRGGSNTFAPASNGFACTTCHDMANWPNRLQINTVTMPSGTKVTFGEGDDNNLCISCHQGRESTTSVNLAIGSNAADSVVQGLSFKNSHYFQAGATLFGNDAQGMYQFKGKTYFGQNDHPGDGSFAKCVACHETHGLEVKVSTCQTCHSGVTDPQEIRWAQDTTDWDGDGDATEPLSQEIATLRDNLYTAIQTYAKSRIGQPIVYNSNRYPYFFNDTNENGVADPEELSSDNGYKSRTPRLVIATYNLHYLYKDPGAFAHNGMYVIQVLYDTLQYIGYNMAGLVRP